MDMDNSVVIMVARGVDGGEREHKGNKRLWKNK